MVGIFDSGSGGLTVMKAVREVLPSANIVYFGDIAHAPYGEKSQEELARYTAQSLVLLRKQGATKILSACNTASSSLALSLFDAFGVEPGSIIEMVGPTVSYFKNTSERILLVATPATVRSGIYQNAFHLVGKEIRTVAIAGLAGAIEFDEGAERQRALIAEALQGVRWSEYDVVVLACTHYPLVSELFRRVAPEQVVVFDPAVAVAERAQAQFWPQEVGEGATRFLISKDSEPFRALVNKVFPAAANNIEVL